ncbi:MAG: polysaccharide deacetylase family protein [Tepidisphaeraceae bacterium]
MTSSGPNSRSFITTSWDDGSPLDFRVAELLVRYNLSGTFYIPRTCGLEFSRPTMGANSIRRLSETFEIGGHTLDHATLTGLPPSQANRQIHDCKTWVEDVTGKSCTMFCPPCGKYSKEHLSMVRSAGFDGLRTVEMFSIDPPRAATVSRVCFSTPSTIPEFAARQHTSNSLAVLPTTLQAHPHGRLAYLRNIARRFAARNLHLYLLAGAKTAWPSLAATLARRVMEQGGVFHLWGHSWEIEATHQWHELEVVLRMLSSLMPNATRLSNGQLAGQTFLSVMDGDPT